jgi:hypothetical protein
MKRPLLIILGIVTVLILLGVWVYVLLNGTPSNGGMFNDFDFGDTTDQTIQPPAPANTEPTVNLTSPDALRQLTTSPVAGFAEVQENASGTPRVQYVEAGTGHIFTIDLETGEEKRVSATTIGQTTRAAITPDGAHVMLQAGVGQATEFIIGTLATTSDELRNFALSDEVSAFAASGDNEFLYLSPDGNGTLAKAYNPKNNRTRVLFTIPFREVAIDWNQTAAGPHLVYPKAANRLEGFIFSYTNGVKTRLPISGFGLSAVGSNSTVLSSEFLNTGDYVTQSLTYTDQTATPLPISIIPEKCAFLPTQTNNAICGAPITEYNTTQLPDSWYRGDLVKGDSLWDVRTGFSSAILLSNITSTKGQTVDLINPQFTSSGERYYFQNKIDQTLWVYDFTI